MGFAIRLRQILIWLCQSLLLSWDCHYEEHLIPDFVCNYFTAVWDDRGGGRYDIRYYEVLIIGFWLWFLVLLANWKFIGAPSVDKTSQSYYVLGKATVVQTPLLSWKKTIHVEVLELSTDNWQSSPCNCTCSSHYLNFLLQQVAQRRRWVMTGKIFLFYTVLLWLC